MRQFYSQFITDGDLVFDIGANHGNRTEIFLALGAKTVAYEPQPICANDLKRRFKKEQNFTLVQKALGASVGKGTMDLCQADTISSMSKQWVESVRKSGRFSEYEWDRSLEIEVSTLDNEISRFGKPSFLKIDVEGYESKVLSGLNMAIDAISFEFTPEDHANTVRCVERLMELGDYEFNYSLGESMSLELPALVCAKELLEIISRMADSESKDFGDIYAFLRTV